MTKVIENIELLKKLQPYLGETKYYIKKYNGDIEENIFNEGFLKKIRGIKTITTEEAYNLLPCSIGCKSINIMKSNKNTTIQYFQVDEKNIPIDDGNTIETFGKTLLEAVEKMLEYLVDNNLLKDE